MSVLLAQELEEVSQVKSEISSNNSGKKRSSKKSSSSREKQQSYGSKDSIKIVNEIGSQEVSSFSLF